MKYRKKPVEVDAIKYTGKNFDEMVEFCHGGMLKHTGLHPGSLRIHTSEGTIFVMSGDWVIKRPYGVFYPCKPWDFEKTYEEVKDDEVSAKHNDEV